VIGKIFGLMLSCVALVHPAHAADGKTASQIAVDQCRQQFLDALDLQVAAENVMLQKEISSSDVAHANAAASLGTLKLLIAERMGCPKVVPGASFPGHE
jgi:hypothetical protein